MEFSLSHGKVRTYVPAFMDLLKLSCMTLTIQYVSLLVLKPCPAEDALGPEVRALIGKQGTLPCWHQTNWHHMEPHVLPRGPAGPSSCQSSRGDRMRGASGLQIKAWTNKQSENMHASKEKKEKNSVETSVYIEIVFVKPWLCKPNLKFLQMKDSVWFSMCDQ